MSSPPRPSAVAVPVALAVVVVLVLGACPRGGEKAAPPVDSSPPVGPAEQAVRDSRVSGARRGGVVRVAVWGAPDPGAATLGGAAVRSLVLPQMFRARPDGGWSPALVEPTSDVTGADGTTASFRLRDGAVWSDGSPITADDLRRTMDPAFVAAVDGPAADGTISVRFTSPMRDWRRLWSGVDSVGAPRDGVWGGPFVVSSVTPGLETVLRRNEAWVGDGGPPLLDEVRLVLVPDPTTARQLLERGEIDVVAPPAETARTSKLSAVDGVEVDEGRVSAAGGWWVGMFLQPDRLEQDERRAVVSSVDRDRFVSTLLAGEAAVLAGLAVSSRSVWRDHVAGDTSALGDAAVDLVGQIEEPMTPLLHRAMHKRVRESGARLELRQAEADRVESWLREGSFEAAIAMVYDGPSVCWRCRWGSVDAALASAADAGDAAAVAALEQRLRDDALVLPLWRPTSVVAWRTGVVDGVRANAFALSPASDAWRWSTAPVP